MFEFIEHCVSQNARGRTNVCAHRSLIISVWMWSYQYLCTKVIKYLSMDVVLLIFVDIDH